MNCPYFSILVTTRGGERMVPLRRLIESLVGQRNVLELILIDQSLDGEVSDLVTNYKDLVEIKYYKSVPLSLSKARNLALKMSKGYYILLGDDDCWYPTMIFKSLWDWLESNNFPDSVCGRTYDPENKAGYGDWRKHLEEGLIIRPSMAFKYPVSITIAVKREIFPYFDERLGLGAQFPSGEETDVVLEIIDKSQMITAPCFVAFHPYKAYEWRVAYKSGIGMGFVVGKAMKSRQQYGILFEWFYILGKSVIGAIFHLIAGRSERSLICVARVAGIGRGLLIGLFAKHPKMHKIGSVIST